MIDRSVGYHLLIRPPLLEKTSGPYQALYSSLLHPHETVKPITLVTLGG